MTVQVVAVQVKCDGCGVTSQDWSDYALLVAHLLALGWRETRARGEGPRLHFCPDCVAAAPPEWAAVLVPAGVVVTS